MLMLLMRITCKTPIQNTNKALSRSSCEMLSSNNIRSSIGISIGINISSISSTSSTSSRVGFN